MAISTISFARSAYKIEGNNVIVDLEDMGVKSRILKVEIWSDNTVKIVSGMKVNFSSFESLIPDHKPAPIKFKVDYAQNNIEVTTKSLLISIQEDGLVKIFNREGNKLLIESDRKFEPSLSDNAEHKIKQRYFLSVHEDIYGFGQDDKATRYNIRNQSFQNQQTTSRIASPILFSEKGYALIWDNYSVTNFNDAKSGLEISSELADEIQYFFVYGPSWVDVISEIRDLTGRVPLLPRWAYGHWLYPGNYSSMDELNSRVKSLSEAGIQVETETTSDYSFYLEEKSITQNTNQTNNRLGIAFAYSQLKPRYEEAAKSAIDRRVCIPTHTNFPGIQKYGTFIVAGDIPTSWETLNSQVGAGVNLSLSGQPYWSSNLGGSSAKEESDLSTFDELMVRWYQFSAFTPIFRSPRPDRDILTLSAASRNYKAIENAIKLRYHLLPYIYTTASNTVFNNKTFMRSLLFDYRNDEKAHSIDQQYLFGMSMMICPVTKPGISQLPVYLPKDNNWVDFWSGKTYTGNATIQANVSIDNIPVFVKAGSIIPLAINTGNNDTDSLAAPLEIRIYPGQDCEFTLYEDANDGPGYLNKQFSKIDFIYSEKDKTLTIGNLEGSYLGMIPNRKLQISVVSETNGTGLNPSGTTQEVDYKGKKIKLKLN